MGLSRGIFGLGATYRRVDCAETCEHGLTVKSGFFQFDVAFGEKERNLDKVRAALSQVDFDLMVLPELFTTGYLLSTNQQAAQFAESIPNGETVRSLIELAGRKHAHIVGGMIERDGDRIYNTAVIVGPAGFVGKHRKVHLTKYEVPLFDRGSGFEVFDIGGGCKLGVVLCFDTWFPEACRVLMSKGAQVLCSPANFGGPWSVDILKVRAVENIVYAISANRIGTETANGIVAEFRGESQIVSCDGLVLQHAGIGEAVAVAEIEPKTASVKRSLMCDDLLGELERYVNP